MSKKLEFKMVERKDIFLFPENEPITMRLERVEKRFSRYGENYLYTGRLSDDYGKLRDETICFYGNRYLNSILPNCEGKFIRLTYLGYKDKLHKIGRDYILEIQV